MGEREPLTGPAPAGEWQRSLRPLLDAYLRRFGIDSPDVRTHWVEHVLAGLQMHLEDIAPGDLADQAVEHLCLAIEARLGRLTNLDAVHERREIGGILAMLGDARYNALRNHVFADTRGALDTAVAAQLVEAIERDRPRPVPARAPLQMPEQVIQLRSPRALLRRLRGAE